MSRLELHLSLPGKQNAALELSANGLNYAGRIVPQNHGPHAEVIVDEPITIDIDEICALAAIDDKRGRRDAQAKIAADTAGQVLGGCTHLLLGSLERIHQCDSRGIPAWRRPTRKSRSQP